MHSWIVLLTAVLILCCRIGASELITELSSGNMDQFVRENPAVLVNFYDPMCPHCQNMVEAYKKLAFELRNLVRVAQVNVMENRLTAKEAGVKGLPSLFLYENGEQKKLYGGNREVDDMVSFVMNNVEFKAESIDSRHKLELFLQSSKTMKVILAGPIHSEYEQLMSEIRAFLPLGVQFGQADDPALLADYAEKNITEGALLISEPKDARQLTDFSVVKNLSKYQRVARKLKRDAIPLIVELSLKYRATFADLDTNVILIFAPNAKIDRRYKEIMLKGAVLGREQYEMYFAVADTKKEKSFANTIGVQNESPQVGIYHFANKLKYRFIKEEQGEFNEQNFLRFIHEVGKGKVRPYLRSQPVPPPVAKSHENPIVKLVGDTFSKFVNDKTRDRILLVHIAGEKWGYDRQQFDYVAKRYFSYDSFVIGEIEVPANEVPGEWMVADGLSTRVWLLPGKIGGRVEFRNEIRFINLVQFLSEYAGLEVRKYAQLSMYGDLDDDFRGGAVEPHTEL